MQTVLSRPPNTHGGVDRHNHSATVSMIHGIPELRISRKVSCTREGGVGGGGGGRGGEEEEERGGRGRGEGGGGGTHFATHLS